MLESIYPLAVPFATVTASSPDPEPWIPFLLNIHVLSEASRPSIGSLAPRIRVFLYGDHRSIRFPCTYHISLIAAPLCWLKALRTVVVSLGLVLAP